MYAGPHDENGPINVERILQKKGISDSPTRISETVEREVKPDGTIVYKRRV
jgi:hypothetical protein